MRSEAKQIEQEQADENFPDMALKTWKISNNWNSGGFTISFDCTGFERVIAKAIEHEKEKG